MDSDAFLEITVRLASAAIIGAILGLNRDLRGKPTGVRTLGLVALGSALAVFSVRNGGDSGAASRVIQGILTGIGFLGAGVIVRTHRMQQIQGLTTAACVWLTACIGAACAIADWWLIVIAVILALIILTLGGRFEDAVHERWYSPSRGERD